MLKDLPKMTPAEEQKIGPSNNVLNAILNYSKSLEVAKIKKQKVLIHMN